MPTWLVITADNKRVGRGVRGYALVWFLQAYYGRRDVARQTPAQARRAPPRADTLLLGLPTSLEPDEIGRLMEQTGCRRVVPFDYLDHHELAWTPEQAAVLRSRTDRYLKPWFEEAWDDGVRHGLLPLRLRRRMRNAILLARAGRALGRTPQPLYDVAFLGRPNRTYFYSGGAVHGVDQRVEWLAEIRREAPELVLFGGLTHRKHPLLRPEHSHLCFPQDKVGFFAFWRAMRRSRVLLTPGGNVPWTYRHYESLYAGGVVVSVDYTRRDMLIPLPRHNMVQVPDGAPVLPAVREGLRISRERPEHSEQTYAHLEQYLRHGAYSRTRPKLLERFLAQLD